MIKYDDDVDDDDDDDDHDDDDDDDDDADADVDDGGDDDDNDDADDDDADDDDSDLPTMWRRVGKGAPRKKPHCVYQVNMAGAAQGMPLRPQMGGCVVFHGVIRSRSIAYEHAHRTVPHLDGRTGGCGSFDANGFGANTHERCRFRGTRAE